MPDKSLYDMTQDEALEYLRGLEGIQNIGKISATGGVNEYDPVYWGSERGGDVRPVDTGEFGVPEGPLFSRNVTPLFDPNYGGGVYGYYEGIYDKDGNLKDVKFRKGERHEGFLSENLETIGPLVVLGSMGLGGGLFGLGGTEAAAGAGATGMDFGAGIEAGMAGGAGATESGLGAFTQGMGDSLILGGEGAGALGEGAGATGMDFGVGVESTMPYNQAYTAAIEAGMTPAQATMAAETAAGLSGSGMSMSGMVGSGVDAAGAAGATGAVGAGGSVVGGGGTITPGLTGAAGAGAGTGLTGLLSKLGVNSVYDALKLGMLGAGAAGLLGSKGGGGTTGGGGLANLVTPTTFTRTVNPQATPLTSKDAYAYLRGEPSPTTGKAVSTGQQNWFNDKFTQQDTYNPVTGEQFVKDPSSGQMIPLKDIQAAQAQVDANKTGDTATGADGGIVALARGGHYSDMLDGSTLGSYSDGGRLLRGPGDGVSDSIPATIAGKHPARLADGEFVVPARIVSELGNGSTEAGARKLYQMMDRIQAGRRKTVGKNSVAKDSKSDKHLPA